MKSQAEYFWRSIEIKTCKRILRGIPIPPTIYDFGCGHKEVAKQVFFDRDIIGVDNQGEPDIKADMLDLPIEDNSLDFIFCNSVLEHIKASYIALDEMSRVLKVGGKLLMTVPTTTLTINMPFGVKTITNLWIKHYSLYDYSSWKEILEHLGFKINNHYYYLSEQSTLRWWKILFLNKLGISYKKETLDKWIKEEYEHPTDSCIAIIATKI